MSDTFLPIKIVISGPVGAGKTTFIQSLSETEVVCTDELASEDIGKELTTVAMDFGTMHIDDYPIYLFGTPGQDRFDFMWEVLCEGALGLIILVAGDQPRDFSKARRILEFITSQVPLPFLIGVTRQDLPRVWGPEDVAEFFQLPQELVVGLNARGRYECITTLFRVFQLIHQHSSDAFTARR